MECFWAIKKKEILPFGAAWITLEGIMLTEINQTETGKHCMISLIHGGAKVGLQLWVRETQSLLLYYFPYEQL